MNAVNYSMKSPRFVVLDGMRGVAALIVFLLHICDQYHIAAIPSAHLAVDFFFILSGFVVANAYEEKLYSKRMTLLHFLQIRLIRLYPMVVVGTLLGAFVFLIRVLVAHSFGITQLVNATVSALLLLPTRALFAFYPGVIYPVNPPEWSLFFEFSVNIAYALLIRFLSNKLLFVVWVISGLWLLTIARTHSGLGDVGHADQTFLLGFIRVVFSFFCGVAIFRAFRCRILTIKGGGEIFLICLLVCVLCMPFFGHSWLYEFFLVGLFFPAVVWCGAMVHELSPARNACLLFLGELSYPLYITHQPVIRIVANAGELLHLHFPTIIAILMCVFTGVAVAYLLAFFWDKPVRSFLLKTLHKHSVGRI